MKKIIATIGIVMLFMGMACLPAGANAITEEPKGEGPGWKYFVIGRIRNYEIFEYNGTKYIEGKAICVRALFWGILENFPNVPLASVLRFGQVFNLPYEGVKISGPNLFGAYFIVAKGEL